LGFSFGFNQAEGPEQVIAPDKLIALLIDIVSKNGNLLLNIGPKADGSISDIQLDRLTKLGDWLAVNGDGIFDTSPWVKASPGNESPIRFTRKSEALYAFFLEPQQGPRLTIPGVTAPGGMQAQVLGTGLERTWEQKGSDLVVDIANVLPSPYAVGLKLAPAPQPAG